MFLNEIFNTTVKVTWANINHGFEGEFTLDDAVYEIQLHEYNVTLKSKNLKLIDFGFTSDSNHDLTNRHNASKVFGVIFNACIPKIKKLNPDAILFGTHFVNSQSASRKSLYSRLSNWYARGSEYKNETQWISTKNGEYKILSREKFSDDDLNEIMEFANSIPEK